MKKNYMLKTIATVSAIVCMCSCQDLTAKLPAGAVDPEKYKTAEAAEQMARGVRYEFQLTMIDYMLDAGRMTDEIADVDSLQRVLGVFDKVVLLNQRYLPDETLQQTALSEKISQIQNYKKLQRIRSVASLARRSVELYAPATPTALRGELFAYEAFADIMLADMYCSGIPLSTVDFNGDYTYKPGSSTKDVYQYAVTLFDSAIGLAEADQSVKSLASIGKGRALLALGRVGEASASVADVEPGFRFTLPVFSLVGGVWNPMATGGPIADKKGEVGFSYLSSGDPRIRATGSRFKYPAEQTELIIVDHIEAKLIEAEGLIQAGNVQFLSILNALRTDGTYTVNTSGDTIYNAGTGAVAGLRPLGDPFSLGGKEVLDARIDLLMKERAFWLFFTGRRQGDLRRLIRNYGRTVEDVYPRGSAHGGLGLYANYVDIPIPNDERFNSYFTGCLGRGE